MRDMSNTIVIKNNAKSTIYVFATIINEENMFYSTNNINFDNEFLIINSYYDNYMHDAVHSGVRKYNFIKILPSESLAIKLDTERIINDIGSLHNGKFNYFYFTERKEDSFSYLLDIDNANITQGTAYFNIIR